MDLRRLGKCIITISEKIAKIYNKFGKEVNEDWKESRDVVNRQLKREEPWVIADI
jgi:hypothetical protein